MAAGDPPIVREFKSVLERIAGAPVSLSAQEKEDLVLGCFLKHTVFWGRPDAVTADRLTAYARTFKAEGRLVSCGWMLERDVWRGGMPSWRLAVAP